MSSTPPSPQAIFFDLDNTLFDHDHSLRSAISAVQSRFARLASYTPDELATSYNGSLQFSYDRYLRKEISYEERRSETVRLFFSNLDLADPTVEEVREFRATYQPAYRESRRATAGSVETLCRLRDHGFSLAIISNGQTEDQTEKAESIGVLHLVDRIFTSEYADCAKPDLFIFQLALESLGVSPDAAFMVGDSPYCDIEGALNARMKPVWYYPSAKESQTVMFEHQLPIIHHMSQLLGLLGIEEPPLSLRVSLHGGQISIEGL